jgi:hypothetical protein
MKGILFRSFLTLTLIGYGATAYSQTPGSEKKRVSSSAEIGGTRGTPNSQSRSGAPRVPSSLPESHIPPRSPDLGSPTFPLSPSIGPGSGLLGPEAGRAPSRLRSDTSKEHHKTGSGMKER